MYYKKITKIIQKDFFGIGFFIKFTTDKDIKLKERSFGLTYRNRPIKTTIVSTYECLHSV